MSFQIKEIVLYGAEGRMRRLPFDTGAVNIVTGASMTGKSSLLSIVDYVLGSDECAIPAGPIRDTVAWYGLRLQLLQGEAFVVRMSNVK